MRENQRPSQEPVLPILKAGSALLSGWAEGPYLPIEAFRADHGTPDRPDPYFRGDTVFRSFRSSGTTAWSRSEARFSKEGLERYRLRAVEGFLEVLGEVAGNLAFPGLSLIPPVLEWPDSSLAQMVHWIAEQVPVRYVELADLPAVLDGLDPTEQVWIFGTAFHFVEAIDSGLARRLPPQSIVIETGGTKGRSRSVTRAELYRDLESAFMIPAAQIISEYGMCELACQAYDWVEKGHDAGERWFRFPEGVAIAAVDRLAHATTDGIGALLIHDPERIDAPWPIRTEDLVEIRDERFRLLGRIEKSPLKGCSLKAETVVRETGLADTPKLEWASTPGAVDPQDFLRELRTFVSSEAAANALGRDLGSECAARHALKLLAESLPSSGADLLAAARMAMGDDPARHWLLLLPGNHPLVGIYPVCLATALGCKITVRVPETLEDGLLPLLLDWISGRKGACVARLGADFRLPAKNPPWEKILVYGTDQTVAALRESSPVPVIGNGHRIGAAIVQAGTFDGAKRLAEDAFGLGQAGCMSTRIGFFLGRAEEAAAFCQEVANQGAALWNEPFGPHAALGIEAEAWRYVRLGAHLVPNGEKPLIPVFTLENVTDDLADFVLSERRFVLPLVVVSDHTDQALVKRAASLLDRLAAGTVTYAGQDAQDWLGVLTKFSSRPFATRVLGRAQAPSWDGMHEGHPLFLGVLSP